MASARRVIMTNATAAAGNLFFVDACVSGCIVNAIVNLAALDADHSDLRRPSSVRCLHIGDGFRRSFPFALARSVDAHKRLGFFGMFKIIAAGRQVITVSLVLRGILIDQILFDLARVLSWQAGEQDQMIKIIPAVFNDGVVEMLVLVITFSVLPSVQRIHRGDANVLFPVCTIDVHIHAKFNHYEAVPLFRHTISA